MTSLRDYTERAPKFITFAESEFYPDYLEEAEELYTPVLEAFRDPIGKGQEHAPPAFTNQRHHWNKALRSTAQGVPQVRVALHVGGNAKEEEQHRHGLPGIRQ